MIQKPPERFEANRALSNMLMPVEFGATRGLGVVTVPHGNVLETDRRVEFVQRFPESILGNDVVSGNVGMAGVDAGGDGNVMPEVRQDLGDLFEAAAERKLRARSVLDEDGETTPFEIQSAACYGDRGGGLQQAFLSLRSAKRTGVQDQILGAERQGALYFPAKGLDGFLEEAFRRAGEIDEVVGVDHQRLQIVLVAQPSHLLALRARQLVRLPLART